MSEDLPRPNSPPRDILAERIERLCEDIEKLLAAIDQHDLRLRAVEQGLVRMQTIATILGAIGGAALSIVAAKIFGGAG